MYNNNYSNNGYGNNMYSGGSSYGGIAKPSNYGYSSGGSANGYSYGGGYGSSMNNRMGSSLNTAGYGASSSNSSYGNPAMVKRQSSQMYSSALTPSYGRSSSPVAGARYMPSNGYSSQYHPQQAGQEYQHEEQMHGRPVTKRGLEAKKYMKGHDSDYLSNPNVRGSQKIIKKTAEAVGKEVEPRISNAQKYSNALAIYPKERASGFFGKLSQIMEKDYFREEGKELLSFKKTSHDEDDEQEVSYENVGKRLFSKHRDSSGESSSKTRSTSKSSMGKKGSMFGGNSNHDDHDHDEDEDEKYLAKKEKKERKKLDYFDDDYDTADIFDYDDNFDNPQMYRDQVKKKFWNFLKKKD